MNRRSRLARRLPTLRAARHRRERHAGTAWNPELALVGSADGGALDDWGAAAMELGLVTEPAPQGGEPASLG